jgi:hypothetical protein
MQGAPRDPLVSGTISVADVPWVLAEPPAFGEVKLIVVPGRG